MDFKSPRIYFQSHPNSSTFSTHAHLVNGEPPLEPERNDIDTDTNNPFAETFPDPLCKLNLKETSEFVKSTFPRRESGVVLNPAAAPPTPGRPVFGFSPSGNGGLQRKSFPSKWDDAEKWLVNCSSCHDSPAHHPPMIKPSSSEHPPLMIRASNNGGGSNNNNIINVFSEKSRVFQEKVVAFKAVQHSHHHHDNNSSVRAFNGVLASTDHILLLKDKFTDETQRPSKEAFLFNNPAENDGAAAAMRDAGTEMTPLGSSTTSRCPTPMMAASPARHNTPLDRSGPLGPSDHSAAVDIAHLAKLQLYDTAAAAPTWSSREEEEEEVSKSLRHFEIDNGCDHKSFINYNNNNINIHDSRVATWEEEEKAKCCSRYQREEAKIQAWVNLQNAKAEAQSRKLEVKIQKMKSNLEEKLMKRMGVVHRKAEELRESARKQHSDQMQKATKQHSHKMLNNHCNNNNNNNNMITMNYHSHFSTSCGCFPCNNTI